MSRRQQQLLLLMRRGGNAYASFVQSLSPVVWLRLTETSGTTAANSGSAGATLNGAISGTTTLGQTGKLGANEAYLYDGATSLITVPNAASIQGMTNFTLMLLCNPASAGELNVARLFAKSSEFELRINSAALVLLATVNCASTNAARSTNTALTTSAWNVVQMTYNNSTKTIRLFVNGVEASYSANTVGVGDRASNTNALTIGNVSAATVTFDGLIDEALVIPSVVSDANLLQYATLAGVV